MKDQIVYVPSVSKSFKKTRWAEIKRIIASGKAVRFHYGEAGFHKDVKSLEKDHIAQAPGVDPHFDLVAFRQSGGKSDHIAWESDMLSIEEVDV